MTREQGNTSTLESPIPMHPRLQSPAAILPEATKGIQTILAAVFKSGVPRKTLELVHLRVSQLNGCSACLESGVREARKGGETDERLATLAGWRHAPWFNESERAALALGESVTRIADQEDAVPDIVWDEAARHFDERSLAGLVLWISLTNLFNRLNVSTRQPVPNW